MDSSTVFGEKQTDVTRQRSHPSLKDKYFEKKKDKKRKENVTFSSQMKQTLFSSVNDAIISDDILQWTR